MSTTPNLQLNVRPRRRWLVPVVLVALLLLVAGVLAGLAMVSSWVSMDEVNAVYDRLYQKRRDSTESLFFETDCTKAELEKVIGRAPSDYTRDGFDWYEWQFCKQTSFDAVERLAIVFITYPDKPTCRLAKFESTFTGQDAWEFRWHLLKLRLGWK